MQLPAVQGLQASPHLRPPSALAQHPALHVRLASCGVCFDVQAHQQGQELGRKPCISRASRACSLDVRTTWHSTGHELHGLPDVLEAVCCKHAV